MPLQSQMLRDDRALQDCLVSDPAHVVPGSRGAHVARIQAALQVIDKDVLIPVAELRAKHYGPQTALAVLAFKRKRKIINTAYQTAPDNIVGKMTIARIDQEILAFEQRGNPLRDVCRGSNTAIVPPADATALAVGAPRRPGPSRGPVKPSPTFRNARVSVVFQATDAAVEIGGSVQLLFGQFQKARQLMAPFGLDFAGAGTQGIFPLIGPQVPDAEKQVIPGSEANTMSVRKAAEQVFPKQPGVLRVIFCPFSEKDDRTFGVTDGGPGMDFPKFCLINVRKANPDQGTILHEIIHASRPERREHDGDPTSVFSENIGGRTQLPLEHAEAIAHAFFASILF